MQSTTASINEAYARHELRIANNLKELKALLQAHSNHTGRTHWGHVGDIEHVANQLDQVVQFLRG